MTIRNLMKNLHQNNRFIALLFIMSILFMGSFSFANRMEQERKSQTTEMMAEFKNRSP